MSGVLALALRQLALSRGRAASSVPMTASSFAAWRARLELNKSQVALVLGLSRNAVIGYESGAKRIPLYVALACAAVAHGLPPIE